MSRAKPKSAGHKTGVYLAQRKQTQIQDLTPKQLKRIRLALNKQKGMTHE